MHISPFVQMGFGVVPTPAEINVRFNDYFDTATEVIRGAGGGFSGFVLVSSCKYG